MALKRVLSSFLSCFCCLIREKKLRKRLEKTKIELFNLNNINKQRVLISLILKFLKSAQLFQIELTFLAAVVFIFAFI